MMRRSTDGESDSAAAAASENGDGTTTTTTAAAATGSNSAIRSSRGELPRVKFLTRCDAGVEMHFVSPSVAKDSTFGCVQGVLDHFSEDGSLVAVLSSENVKIYNTESDELVATLPEHDLIAMTFSPQNSFLLTQRRIRPETPFAEGDGNICIWDIKSGERIAVFFQRNPPWPFIRWTSDELMSARMVSTEVQFFVGKTWDKSVKAIRAPGLTNFAFAPGPSPPTVAVFVPEKKGQPGTIRIFKYPKVGEHITQRTVFRASEADFFWNSTGTAVLVHTRTDVDRSGKSYYGEARLQFLSTDPSIEASLAISDEGSVHDMRWSPDGSKCVVIHGYMPAQATLFDSKGKKLADFGKSARNIVRWSPCGRMVVLAGFGNLNGAFDVWDVRKVRRVGTGIAKYSASIDWSPDSQYLLTAVLSPKIRIDNGFAVWKYDGTQIHSESVHNLYQAQFRPAPPRTYPNFPIKVSDQLKGGASPAASPSLKPAIYTPPSRRGLAAPVQPEVSEDSKARKYNNGGGGGGSGGSGAGTGGPRGGRPPQPPVGYTESKAAKRNAQRRQKKKQDGTDGSASPDVEERETNSPQQQTHQPHAQRGGRGGAAARGGRGNGNAGRGGGRGGGNNNNNNNTTNNTTNNHNNNSSNSHSAAAPAGDNEAHATSPAPSSPSPQGSPSIGGADVDPSKKVKALQKKLRQITQLKEKQSQGEVLDGPQLAKVHSEAEVVAEIAKWGGSGSGGGGKKH